MKKIILIYFILNFLYVKIYFAQSITQYGWQWLNPLPTENSLTHIKFADLNTGYAVGDYSTLLKTTNSGINWFFIDTWCLPSSSKYNLLHLFNKDTLIVGGASSGIIYKTINGGSTWMTINTGINYTLHDIYFRNNLTGYVLGEYSHLSKTTDGGNTWFNIPTNTWLFTTSLSFPDDNTGYISANNKIIKTTNGGLSWDTSSVMNANNVSSIYFINNMTGFLAANGIFRTSNGGINWFKIDSSDIMSQFSFIDGSSGWAGGYNGTHKTTDGGISWNLINSGNQADVMYFLNNFTGYSATYGVTIRKTTNGGINWSNQSTSLIGTGDFYAIFFINSNTGFVSSSFGSLYKTTSGGTTWSFLSPQGANKIYFFNESTGFLGQSSSGNHGAVSKTTNGGLNWTTYTVPNPVYNLFFIDINTGYGVGAVSSVIKTTNSGQSWTQIYSGNGWMYATYFLNANTGYAVGDSYNGNFISTTNGGLNWSVQTINNSPGLSNSVYFLNINTGYIACGYAGYQGAVYKTTNAGVNWTSQDVGFPYELDNIQFFDLNNGIACGYNGKVVKTSNGGINWLDVCSVTNANLSDMYFVNSNTGYFCGRNGVILKTTNGGILVDVQKKEITIPKTYILYQNYPNPFNPTTKIKFSIPSNMKSETSNVKIIIYDILGKEVATLVNEKLQPGTYEVEWDASNYASGIYFYKLISGDFTETKKLVLLK